MLVDLAAHEAALAGFANSKALARFGVALLREVRALKAQADALDFDDLIRLASELLTTAEARDWVRYKLDGGVDHILVDEAQDTSAEQWQVIGAIAEEFFQGNSARDAHRTLFVVGDEKQSIYSFQGADPSGLGKIKERFVALTQGAEKTMESPQLLHSFRSTPAVLSAVDTVFSSLAANDGLGRDGEAPTHLAYREDQPGKVEFWPVVEPRDGPDERPWYEPVDQTEPDAPHLRLAEGIATRIRQWLDDGTHLPSRERPIRPGDVLILVRRRNAFTDAMIRALKAKDIAVAGEDRMVLTGQLAVRDLMALARFALLPDDDLTLATVLRSPIVGLSEDDLFTLAQGRKGRLWQALYKRREEGAFAAAYAILDDLQKQADFLRPYEFLERALGKHGARARFLGRLGVQAEDPIDELLSQALAFESAAVPSLQAFVERIDASDFQVKREMEQGRDEVRVMTAHGAKGLEANIVFLPDTVALPPDNRSGVFIVDGEGGAAPIWSRKTAEDPAPVTALREQRKVLTMQEYRRLLYVGMTRAQDWLVVCGYRGAREAKDDSWLRVVEQGFAEGVDCATPLLDEDQNPVMGLMIETDGKKRAPADPVVSVGMSAQPFDAALMADVKSEPAAVAPISPSRLCDDDPTNPPPLPSDDEEGAVVWSSAERGTLMHALLERLAPVAPDARAEVGERGLSDPADILALGTVLEILDDDEFSWMFGAGSLAEVPIAGPVAALGGRAVSGLIDRLIVRDGQVDIVDFKSGRPHDEMPEAYLRQLAVYVAVLREVYSGAEVRAHLLWIDVPRLDTADEAALAGALERAWADLKARS
jgi:ATP-dependent helicase/nuclease subunit A